MEQTRGEWYEDIVEKEIKTRGLEKGAKIYIGEGRIPVIIQDHPKILGHGISGIVLGLEVTDGNREGPPRKMALKLPKNQSDSSVLEDGMEGYKIIKSIFEKEPKIRDFGIETYTFYEPVHMGDDLIGTTSDWLGAQESELVLSHGGINSRSEYIGAQGKQHDKLREHLTQYPEQIEPLAWQMCNTLVQLEHCISGLGLILPTDTYFFQMYLGQNFPKVDAQLFLGDFNAIPHYLKANYPAPSLVHRDVPLILRLLFHSHSKDIREKLRQYREIRKSIPRRDILYSGRARIQSPLAKKT